MPRYWSLLSAVPLVFIAFFTQAADAFDVYEWETLQQADKIYSKNIRLIWEEDLLGRLTVKERQAAGNVKLNVPLRGVHNSLFDYYSSPRTREITIPILSVKFFDDLAIAAAWLNRQECALDPVSDYVGMLRYQGSSLSSDGRFPPPQQALGIPQRALDDAIVNDVSGKALKSAIYFLMAHELGHVIFQHKPYDMIDGQEAQAQEMQADDFALNIMRRISVPPVGMVLFFMMCSRFEPAPGDFPNLQEYENFVRRTSTHPLTSRRLIAISRGIRSNVDAFCRGQKDPTLWQARIIKIADDIEAIGNGLDDRQIRELQKYRSETVKLSDLRTTCRSR